jgi:hypothetical protein
MRTFDHMKEKAQQFDDERLTREIAFARESLVAEHDETVIWLAALLDRREWREQNAFWRTHGHAGP